MRGGAMPLPEGAVEGTRVFIPEHVRNLIDANRGAREQHGGKFLPRFGQESAERRALFGDASLESSLARPKVTCDVSNVWPAACKRPFDSGLYLSAQAASDI